jgi:membrane associated rhomboid family serine protease
MFGLWMFGVLLERVWGSKKFLFFYLFTGIGAGIIQELTWMIDLAKYEEMFKLAIENNDGSYLSSIITNAESVRLSDIIRLKDQFFSAPVTVGASGALFGILLAFGWLFPEQKMFLIFVPIPIPARIFVGIYALVELFLGVSGFAMDNVAHFAHLGGMIFAAILLLIWKKQGKLYL